MFHKSFRKYFVVALALLLCQPMASAKTQMGKPHHTVYAMGVDYNPKTEQLTGLCQVNGHPCWLLLDTGWFGVALFADRQADWNRGKPVDQKTRPSKKQDQKNGVRVQASVRLGPLDFLPDDISVDIIDDTKHYRTSTGQPITGIIGVPFLNIIPTEWNVPEHKIVFWLSGRPKQFLHVPPKAIIACKQDRERRLLMPISVHGRHSEIYFDTGSNDLIVFDSLISDFPAAGPEEGWSGPDLKFRVIPREVKNLKIGPLVFSGTVGGRLPETATKGTPYPYGSMGMSIISHLHLFVTGNKIIFDPHAAHFSSSQ